MKTFEMVVPFAALLAAAPAAGFAPPATAGAAARRNTAFGRRGHTCTPGKGQVGFHVVGTMERAPLFGTGASYTEVIAETDDDGEDGEEGEDAAKIKKKKKSKDKEKVKLEPEVTFFEGGPDISEVAAPTVSILTVIGIVPFTAALARQAWVKYTITSRRIKIVSGWQGKDTTEVVYPDIVDMRFVWRFFGRCGDMVLTLRDGSKLEVRSLPEFERNYNYIRERTSPTCQENSQVLKPQD